MNVFLRSEKTSCERILPVYFQQYFLQRKPQCLKIIADAVVDFQHDDNEIVEEGTPKWWDDYVADKIDFRSFNMYFLRSCTVFHGSYNAVTDHKKVWGLTCTEKGEYDNHYQNDRGRVYLGVVKGDGKVSFLSDRSSMIFMLPKNVPPHADRIFEILREDRFDFLEMTPAACRTLGRIREQYRESIIFKYTHTNEISLTVFGDDLDGWFDEELLAAHSGAGETVCRRL